jgi:hypothetical protein
MTIRLPLPGEESKLIAVAQAKGLSTDALVHEVLDKICADAATNLQLRSGHLRVNQDGKTGMDGHGIGIGFNIPFLS